MKWIFYNPNPFGNNTGDCVIRALTLAFGKTWDDVYSMLAEFGFKNKLMPSSNENWLAAAVDEYGNVTSRATIDVPRCCCITASVEYVSGVTDGTTVPTPSINVIDGSVSIKKRGCV